MFAVQRTRLPLKFQVMRVVNLTHTNDPCAPIERRLAHRAPHLRTPRRFLYHLPTLWTRLCVFVQELHRLHRVWVALVRTIAAHRVVALRAKVLTTQSTVPIFVHEPTTLPVRTLAYESALIRVHGGESTSAQLFVLYEGIRVRRVHVSQVRMSLEMGVVHDWDRDVVRVQETNQLRTQLAYGFTHVTHSQNTFHLGLCVREQGSFPFVQHHLPMSSKFRVSKL